jgi:ribosome-associated protein
MMDSKAIINTIAQAIYDKKGINILALDVRGISTLTDFVIIAEGNVDKHVMGIANSILDTLEEKGVKSHHVEGIKDGDWVVLDFLNVMVHLFMPGLRDKYRLEELWKEGKILDVEIDTTSSATGTYGNSLRK